MKKAEFDVKTGKTKIVEYEQEVNENIPTRDEITEFFELKNKFIDDMLNAHVKKMKKSDEKTRYLELKEKVGV